MHIYLGKNGYFMATIWSQVLGLQYVFFFTLKASFIKLYLKNKDNFTPLYH